MDNQDTKKEHLSERRRSSCQLIENMLKERNQLLALWLRTSVLEANNIDTEDHDLLEEFCQVLVDYFAAGHFGLYERIAEGKERRRDVAETAKRIYPEIEQTTQFALAFIEKYGSENSNRTFSNLSVDLSRLGELLSVRLEFEDQLIEKMLN